LLFHALYDAQAPDVYTVQLLLDLEGALDEEVLRASAAALLRRHAVLRAGFAHEMLGRPVQVIVPAVSLPWRSLDLSGLDETEGGEGFAALLAQDRAEHFDMACPPLVRFTAIRLAAQRHRLVVTDHHILMDGWSLPIVIEELLTLYAAGGDEAALPRVTPYREYLAWLARQDREAALTAWDAALSGLE